MSRRITPEVVARLKKVLDEQHIESDVFPLARIDGLRAPRASE